MVLTKLYLYDSSATDYKGTDYSDYILSGVEYTDDLTEVLDVCELTLAGLPTSEEFAPTTKFILEIYDSSDTDTPYDTYHLCVASDVVSQPILSDNNYFNHAITFNEASVIAQGRIVDDCSETYKLKDVSLTTAPTYSLTETCQAKETNTTESSSGYANGYTSTGSSIGKHTQVYKFTRKFEFKFGGEYDLSGSLSDWNSLEKNQVVDQNDGTIVTLPIPLIVTRVGEEGSINYDSHENFCSTKTMVFIRTLGSNNSWQLDTTVGDGGVIITNPSTTNAYESDWENDWGISDVVDSNTIGYGTNRFNCEYNTTTRNIVNYTYYKKFAEFDNAVQNRTLTINLQNNKEYKIVCTLNNINTSVDELGLSSLYIGDAGQLACYSSQAVGVTYVTFFPQITNTNYYVTDSGTDANNNPALVLTFNSYAEGATTEAVFTSAPELSAYDLFIDAQLKSQELWREDVSIKDPSTLPYYCNADDVDALKNVAIIESSYHQKNFWEILLEIGKYIHAIPYITFGENDRYLVTWRYLGLPTQYDDNSTTMSIFNSRSVENYVGAVNSYINNMVQLGGLITEWVAPKSESEDYLVYNDVAVLKTSKPIIEIYADENSEGGIIAKCIRYNSECPVALNATTDITSYVFENSIYQLLGVVSSVTPNKGLGIYYNLGENVIRGLNYQLPSVNTGDADTEYAIKRILGTAFGMSTSVWEKMKINDFVFQITYRTKENVRSEQSRPDLRKYLVNSAYETIPQHKQFNNQQDVSVDSVKFGNQTYGKLIKIGNTEIQTTEWSDNLFVLKNAGQLINIRDNLYYVSKVTHTFYQDHIDSNITFSKDYNQLSDIIGIPSEPRFYEISERNIVDRQVNANSYLVLGTGTSVYLNKYITSTGMGLIKDILFATGTTYPRYALTEIKNDATNDVQYTKDLIHPISGYSMRNTLSFKWEMQDNFSAGDSVNDVTLPSSTPVDSAYAELLPTQYVDMYGRGDLYDFLIVDDISFSNEDIKNQPNSPIRLDSAGKLINYLGYGVTYSQTGLADLQIYPTTTLGFILFSGGSVKDSNSNVIASSSSNVGDYFIVSYSDYVALYRCSSKGSSTTTWVRVKAQYKGNYEQYEVPSPSDAGVSVYFGSDYKIIDGSITTDFGTNEHGLALAKDNREHLMFNFNLQMLTDSDRFVLSGYMWRQEKEGTIKLATLNEEVNKIINDTIDTSTIINTYDLDLSYSNMSIFVNVSNILSGVDVSDVKSIAIISTAQPQVGTGTKNYFVMARNVSDLEDEDKVVDWNITSPSSTFFEKQQTKYC